ncbi:30S ribosomal protein S8 [Candidatus Peregrinibacteria bacterium]|nr:30S ribosomal protein S8 [Candidatus Peregrinibacteria bacterium]
MFTDPIADFLTRIRNAGRARKRELSVRGSRMLKSIADVLKAKNMIASVEEMTIEGGAPELKIVLLAGREPLELKRISKSGQRIYVGYEDIKRVRNGFGVAIISTSHGVMSGDEARKLKIGGEYICEVY